MSESCEHDQARRAGPGLSICDLCNVFECLLCGSKIASVDDFLSECWNVDGRTMSVREALRLSRVLSE